MKIRTGFLALVPALAIAHGASAQDEDGGVRLSIGVSERVSATRNLALDPVSQGTTIRSDTSVRLSFSSVTRTQQLTFSSSAALNAVNPANGSTSYQFTTPGLSFGYARQGAGSNFGVNASLTSRDISFLRPLEDFLNEEGELELPNDLADLKGTGTRLSYGGSTSLDWGQDGPLGMGISAGVRFVDYRDAGPALFDNRTAWAALRLQMKPTEGRSLSSSLRFSRFDSDNPTTTPRDTISLSNRLSLALPSGDGQIFGSLGITHVDAGTRYSLGAGMQKDLPGGSVGFTLNGTRTLKGTLALTGAVNLQRDLPVGQFSARVRRSVTEDSNNAERLVTSAGVSFSRDLTPRTSLSLGADYARTKATATNSTVTNATLRASVGHQLTPDWNINLGYDRRYRNESAANTGWVSSDRIFFGLSRNFDVRF